MEYGTQEKQPDLEPDADPDDEKYSKEDLAAETDRWTRELAAAKKWLQPLKDQAKKIEAIIRDERELDALLGESRWNLFAANRETKAAMLYGRPPRVSVERRFSDETDDVGRVAGTITTRLLNADIERTSDGFSTALMSALLDRLDHGWSMVRERYVVEWEDVPETPAKMGMDPMTGQQMELAPAVPATRRKRFEDVETDYIHLEDQLWQPSRTHAEMDWWSHCNQMSKEEVAERWGDEVAERINYNAKPPVMGENYDGAAGIEWKRADIREIWDRRRKKVIWFCEGYGAIECLDDPYELDGFYPFPRPMVANPTTSKYLPRPDYVIAQDLYTELNLVTTRIKTIMAQGVRVTGLYDAKHQVIPEMLQSSGDGTLLPVENWAALAGDGGLANSVFFFPTQEMVASVMQLRDYRRELIDAIAQVTGMSDIMRGEATQAGATATEQRVKTRMGSVRMQALQDDFARFASDAQKIRAQLMAKFFDEETIKQRSNADFLPQTDQAFVQEAIALIKSPGFSQYRIEVKSEAISLSDFAATKAEKFEAAGTLGQVVQMMLPVKEALGPGGMPFVLQLGKSMIAGMRGANDMESAFDAATKVAEQAAQQAAQQPAPPDPKVQAEQMKMQSQQMKTSADMQKEQFKHQAKLEQIQAEVVADDQREQSQANWNTREAANKALITHALKPVEVPKPGGIS